MNFDDISKVGLGGLGLLMLYSILKPLIASLIASQSEFVKTLSEFSTTLQGIVKTVDAIRDESRGQAAIDKDHAERILRGEGCRAAKP